MVTFLIINGALLVLMLAALIWVRVLERRQKAAKAAARERTGAAGPESEEPSSASAEAGTARGKEE